MIIVHHHQSSHGPLSSSLHFCPPILWAYRLAREKRKIGGGKENRAPINHSLVILSKIDVWYIFINILNVGGRKRAREGGVHERRKRVKGPSWCFNKQKESKRDKESDDDLHVYISSSHPSPLNIPAFFLIQIWIKDLMQKAGFFSKVLIRTKFCMLHSSN